jgi:hypothetical protein
LCSPRSPTFRNDASGPAGMFCVFLIPGIFLLQWLPKFWARWPPPEIVDMRSTPVDHREGYRPTSQSRRMGALAPPFYLISAITGCSLHAVAILTMGTANLNASVRCQNQFKYTFQLTVTRLWSTMSPTFQISASGQAGMFRVAATLVIFCPKLGKCLGHSGRHLR